MRHTGSKGRRLTGLRETLQTRNRRIAFLVCLLAAGAGMVAAVHAYSSSKEKAASPRKPSAPLGPAQKIGPRRTRYYDRLSLQPVADRMRMRLGQRFKQAGREISESAGTLTIGTDRHAIVIVRIRNDDGESVSIGLDGGPQKYFWTAADGAQSQGKTAAGIERALIERLALDNPDQFVLAQLRGAAYYTAARAVRPAGVGDSEDYQGPIWDVVQITEPANLTTKPECIARLYYINNATGLIDKSLSRDQSGPIYAEFTDWVTLGGELLPLRTTWRLEKQVIMELILSTTVTKSN